MAAFPSRQFPAVYIYSLILYSIKPPVTTGLYFKLISGIDTEISAGHAAPYTNQEFFECGMQQSCTHVIKVGSGFLTVHGKDELGRRKHEAEFIYEKMKLLGKIVSLLHCRRCINYSTRSRATPVVFSIQNAKTSSCDLALFTKQKLCSN